MPAVPALVSHILLMALGRGRGQELRSVGFWTWDQRNTESAPEAMRGELGGIFLRVANVTLEGSGSKPWRGAGETDRQTDTLVSSLQTQPLLRSSHIPPWIPGDPSTFRPKSPFWLQFAPKALLVS